ncbi:MAG: hypothetical protein LBT88_04750 [Oscillospiraceae bacterium]|jgi:hypothetical protein|nr:hypothetical protein [Oscillospiraceae bacterium]
MKKTLCIILTAALIFALLLALAYALSLTLFGAVGYLQGGWEMNFSDADFLDGQMRSAAILIVLVPADIILIILIALALRFLSKLF